MLRLGAACGYVESGNADHSTRAMLCVPACCVLAGATDAKEEDG
jgi:hypothetical protein